MRERWMLMFVVVAFLCLTNWTRGANSSTTKTTWEYKVVSVYVNNAAPPPSNPTELINAGMEGWELIAIRSGNYTEPRSNQVRLDYYFKR
jgi:hypothetical protein